jgi:hypothetical protein
MRVKVLAVLGATALLAGCDSTVAGTPTTAVSTSATPSADAAPGVPKVTNPIDTTRFEKEPCAALTPDQLAQLAITTEPRPDLDSKFGPGCEWNAYDEIGLTVGGVLLTVGSSLASLYKQHEQGQWPLFEPTDVAGYPGVKMDSLDAQPRGKCGVSVAVRDDLIYSLQVSISSKSKDYEDPCSPALKAAELAVSTMKAGA